MNVYYDYQPINFKINKHGNYDSNYIFDLDDGYEIEFPLYLPNDLKMTGAHKLRVTFGIGSKIHAKELNTLIGWYGATAIQDIIFEPTLKNVNFDHHNEYEMSKGASELQFNYTLNRDYDYSILKTGIMPLPPVSLTVHPNQKFKVIYNIYHSEKKSGQVLLLVTIGFKQTSVNNNPYLLIKVPAGKTAVGEISLIAPEKPGLYELISYGVSSPYEKFDGLRRMDFTTQASPRFTLEVKEK